MRIFQVIYSFNVGGSEAVARDIALKMGRNTIHGIAALESDGPLRQVLNKAGVKTYVINRRPNERVFPMIRLWKAMRSFKPDVVHTHHFYEFFYSWPGALLTGARVIHTEHEYFSLMAPKVQLRLRKLSYFCHAITGVNEETSQFIREKIGINSNKIYTIENGIDLDRYGLSAPNRQSYGLAQKDVVVGIVARLVPVKDHDTLLRAFRIVADSIPMAKLIIIGDGSERNNLERLVERLDLEGLVRFLGNRNDIPELLSCLDVAVLSSTEEGLPLSILEAMACGKPVVATNVGGIPAVIQHGKNGVLVSTRDISGMANALLDVLSDKNRAEKMGMNGRKLIEKRYDLNYSLKKYFALYKDV